MHQDRLTAAQWDALLARAADLPSWPQLAAQVAELQAQVAALQARVAVLEAARAATSPPVLSPAPPEHT
jgi:hypothetical protein